MSDSPPPDARPDTEAPSGDSSAGPGSSSGTPDPDLTSIPLVRVGRPKGEPPPPPPKGPLPLAIVAIAMLGGYLLLAGLDDPPATPWRFVAIQALLAGLYVVALLLLRGRPCTRTALVVVLGAAALFRVVMLADAPVLSDDIHRYVRDGWVQVQGFNPYANAPDDPALEHTWLPNHDAINNPDIPTIYPPLAQMLFAAAAFVTPSPLALKVLFVLFEAGMVWILAVWVRAAGGTPLELLIYAWHPLAVIEVAGSGHVDVVGAFFLVLTASLIIEGRKLASSAALAGSILAKLLPLMLLPLLLRRLRNRDIFLLAAIVIVLGAPYYAGAAGNMFTGFGEYTARWEYNAPVYIGVREALEIGAWEKDLEEPVKGLVESLGSPAILENAHEWVYPARLARLVCLAVLLVLFVPLALRSKAPEVELFVGLGMVLILSPTLHPWYLLWILPFFVILRSPAWIWLSLAIPLTYLSLGRPDGGVPPWILAVEYVPMLVLAIAWWRRDLRRRVRVWAP